MVRVDQMTSLQGSSVWWACTINAWPFEKLSLSYLVLRFNMLVQSFSIVLILLARIAAAAGMFSLLNVLH